MIVAITQKKRFYFEKEIIFSKFPGILKTNQKLFVVIDIFNDLNIDVYEPFERTKK